MGGSVGYNDIPDGFQVKSSSQISYSDMPEGYSVKNSLPSMQKDAGLSTRIGEDISKRQQQSQDVSNKLITGEMNPVGATLGHGSEVIGGIGDVGTEVAKSAWGKLPNFITNPVETFSKHLGEDFAKTPEGVALSLIAPAVKDRYQKFEKESPNTAAGFNFAGNVAKTAPIVQGEIAAANLAKLPLKTVREGINSASDAMAKAATVAKKTPDMLREEAHIAYDASNQIGATYNPQATNRFLAAAKTLLPKSERVADLFSDEPAAVLVRGLDKFSNTPMSLSEAEELDQKIGQMASKHVDVKTGKLDADGQALYDLQQKLRDVVFNPKEGDLTGGKAALEASKRGRELWAQSARLRDIDSIMERANLSENPITAAKNGFKNLILNKARFNAYSDEEKALIKKAAQGTMPVVNVLRMFGSRLVPIGATVAGAAATGGISGGLMEGAAAHAGSTVARKLAEKAYMTKPNAIREAVIGRKVTPMPTPKPKSILQLTYQPEKPEILVNRQGDVWKASEAETVANNQTRERMKGLGLDTGTLKAQDLNRIRALEKKYGSSELGKFMIAHKDEPIMSKMWEVPDTEYSKATVDKMLNNALQNKLDKAVKEKLDSEIQKAWESKQFSIADIVMAGDKAAKDLAKVGIQKGRFGYTNLGDIMIDSLKSGDIPSSLGTSFDDFLDNQ